MRVCIGLRLSFARAGKVVPICFAILTGAALAVRERPAELTARVPLHLEDHLDEANVVGSPIPDEAVRSCQIP